MVNLSPDSLLQDIVKLGQKEELAARPKKGHVTGKYGRHAASRHGNNAR